MWDHVRLFINDNQLVLTNKLYFIAGDPGPFCLGRPGLYLHEINTWIIFLIFKANDVHSGFSPIEDPLAHQKWVDENLDAAWDFAGPENRCGFVTYFDTSATQRNASMAVTNPCLFGNFGPRQNQNFVPRDFATFGKGILGGNASHANRLGREAIYGFWNALQYSGLYLNIPLQQLPSFITFKDENGNSIPLQPLPLSPDTHSDHIKKMVGFYLWYQKECNSMHILLRKQDFKKHHALAKEDLRASERKKYLIKRSSLIEVSKLYDYSFIWFL
jgi:hypothetical protein